jgi:hypothetical protein
MARDKRGQEQDPNVNEVLDELANEEVQGLDAGPTSRNEAGNTKRAAAKATGQMGASKKMDPDLRMDDVGPPVKSGSPAGIHGFNEVPPERGAGETRSTRANAEIAEKANTTARKAPAGRSAQTDSATGPEGKAMDARSRARVPAPGNAVDVPKGTLVRGHPTATQSGGKSTSSTGERKPPKRSARAHSGQVQRPLSKGGSEERDRD